MRCPARTSLLGLLVAFALASCGPRPEPPALATPTPTLTPTPTPSDARDAGGAAASSTDAGGLDAHRAGAAPTPTVEAAAAPAAVDPSLFSPDSAALMGEATDGTTLLRLHALGPGGRFPMHPYVAVLDSKHDCIVETLGIAMTTAASGGNDPSKSLRALESDAMRAELAHLESVATKFGARRLGAVIFGAAGFTLLEVAGQPHYRRANGAWTRIDKLDMLLGFTVPSPDGRFIAGFGDDGVARVLDTRTLRVRTFPVGHVSFSNTFRWSADSRSLVFDFNVPMTAIEGPKACIARVVGDAPKASPLHCYPRAPRALDAGNRFRASPSGAYVGIRAAKSTRSGGVAMLSSEPMVASASTSLWSGPESEGDATYHVLVTASGAEAFAPKAVPDLAVEIDDAGRVAWGHRSETRLASKDSFRSFADGGFVGFLRDGSLLLLPRRPARPLSELGVCGHFAIRKTR